MQKQVYYEFACIETGEIKKFTAWTELDQIENLPSKRRQPRFNQPFFTCINMDAVKEASSKLKEKDCGYLLVLQSYIDYKGRLLYKKQPLTKTGIMKILNIKKTTFSCFMNEMHKHNIILKDENGYKVNQKYHWTGRAKVNHFVKTYKKALRDLYKANNSSDMGFIYKLLPFIHQETNILCHNPYEPDQTAIEPLMKKDIAKLMDVSEKTVYNKVKGIKWNEMYIIAEVNRDNERKKYMINPFVINRNAGRPDKNQKSIFEII